MRNPKLFNAAVKSGLNCVSFFSNLAFLVWKIHLAPALEACWPREMLKGTLGHRERDSVHLILPAAHLGEAIIPLQTISNLTIYLRSL